MVVSDNENKSKTRQQFVSNPTKLYEMQDNVNTEKGLRTAVGLNNAKTIKQLLIKPPTLIIGEGLINSKRSNWITNKRFF